MDTLWLIAAVLAFGAAAIVALLVEKAISVGLIAVGLGLLTLAFLLAKLPG